MEWSYGCSSIFFVYSTTNLERNDKELMNNINDKLNALVVLRPYMSNRDYRCLYANILVDYYANLLNEHDIKKGRRYVLNAVNNHLVKTGLEKVSYQVVRTRMESKWS